MSSVSGQANVATRQSELTARSGSAVTVVRWPEEANLRRALAAVSAPRLLVVKSLADLPPLLDPLEDWVQPPAQPCEVSVRSATLLGRSELMARSRPRLEPGDIVRYGDRWAALAPSSVPIASALIDAFGRCVPRSVLEVDHTGTGAQSRSSLDTRVSRLRSRIKPLGLAIRSVRTHGFLLCLS